MLDKFLKMIVYFCSDYFKGKGMIDFKDLKELVQYIRDDVFVSSYSLGRSRPEIIEDISGHEIEYSN